MGAVLPIGSLMTSTRAVRERQASRPASPRTPPSLGFPQRGQAGEGGIDILSSLYKDPAISIRALQGRSVVLHRLGPCSAPATLATCPHRSDYLGSHGPRLVWAEGRLSVKDLAQELARAPCEPFFS